MPKRKQNAKLEMIGPAQWPFGFFMDLARFMLDTYCIHWISTSKPTSYLFPPTFAFRNPDKSDQDIEEIKGEVDGQKQAGASVDSLQRPVLDRRADFGEFVVFQALWELAQDEVQAPFLAIHSLNLQQIKGHLQQIFPHAQIDIQEKFKAMMREYDFVLIGPKIGIILIEVKSTEFTKERDFALDNKNLPDQIIHGIEQLVSFDLEFFHTCSGIQAPPEVQVRKILFTTNLEKSRFYGWYNKLDQAAKDSVYARLINNGIIHWFKEDQTKTATDSLKLYTRLREMIEADGFQIPQEIYESYGLILSGLGSAVIIEGQTTVSGNRLSTSRAITQQAAALENQDPLQKLQQMSLSSTKSKKQKVDVNSDDVVELNSKLILLTPEQKGALYGPNRQLIIGAAGTGKTIILQAKALQLFKEGKKVLVSSPSSYWLKYQKLFEDHGVSKDLYKIITHINLDRSEQFQFPVEGRRVFWDEPFSLLSEIVRKMVAEEPLLKKIMESVSEHLMKIEKMPDWLTEFDAVLIDDAFDHYNASLNELHASRFSSIILLMAITRICEFDSKVVWIAFDPCLPCKIGNLYKPMVDEIIRGEQEDNITRTLLHRVLRSSECVFEATYTPELLRLLPIKPTLSHKIHGFSQCVHLHNLQFCLQECKNDGRFTIWEHAESAVQKFREEGFDYGQMAIIVAADIDDEYVWDVCDYLCDKFRRSGIPVADASSRGHSPSTLTVDDWGLVSSFEWPVVIYIRMVEQREGEILVDEAYYQYRSCSRATMKLLQIIAHYEVVDLEQRDVFVSGQVTPTWSWSPAPSRPNPPLPSRVVMWPVPKSRYRSPENPINQSRPWL